MKKIITTMVMSAGCFLTLTGAFAHKPYNDIEIKHINLKKFPQKIDVPDPGVEITIGDLHGNALKLIYFLIRNDVMHINKEDYPIFAAIYKKEPDTINAKDLTFFNAIIDSATYSTQHQIRFLGDDLCDRGMNDYYTLSLYKKLDVAGVPFEVVLSNHGKFFLEAYESPEHSFTKNPYGEGNNEATVQSMLNMGILINKGLVSQAELMSTIQKHYLKHLVLPAFTINKKRNEITIYSHAPIDVAMLASLAVDLQTPFNDSNLNELRNSLNAINQQINQWIMSNTLSIHFEHLNETHKKSQTPSPLTQVLWNRDYTLLNRDRLPDNKSYAINYVHGHDSEPNVFNLDNLLGKGAGFEKGPYAVYKTHA